MIKELEYNFYYSGPLLFKSSLMKEDIKLILDLCEKDETQKWNKNLAGLIKKEYKIKNQIKLQKILKPYLILFKKAYTEWYDSSYEDMIVKNAWVNYMRPNESNPIHVHTLCHFSSVFYLKMPKGLKKEIENTETSGSKPGDITFLFNAQDTISFINTKSFTPEVGDFFIFPAGLHHFVNSFQSKGERISLAVNFDII